MMRPLSSFALIVLLACLAGCGTGSHSAPPKGTVTIALDAGKNSTAAQARLDHLVTLVLPTPVVAGHVWQLSFHDARFLQQTSNLASSPDGTWSVSFRTRIPGRTRLRFMLVPAAAGGNSVAAVDSQELVLTIQ